MSKLGAKKLGALIDQHKQKKMPAKKPGFGGGPPRPSKHDEEEAEHEPGETPEHEAEEHGEGGEHDEAKDKAIAEQQAARVSNGNGDDELEGIVAGEEYEAGAEPPEWAKEHDIWERAEKAVEELADIEDDQKMLVLAHTYEALGGEVAGKSGGDEGGEESEEEDDVEPEEEEEDEGNEAPEDL